MSKRRRQIILGGVVLLGVAPASAQPSPLDVVLVYLIPLDDFPEELANSLAAVLQQNIRIRVKASLRLPPLRIPVLSGTNQYVSEEVIARGAAASASLPEMTSTTYRLFLTSRDINARSANFRFQFATHNREVNCSVVSVARLVEYIDDRPVLTERAAYRLAKMVKRAIGEMRLGWARSSDRSDLMYAPIMSLDDLDQTGFEHKPDLPENKIEPVKPESS